MEKPLEVVCQCHQRPFRAHILETAQAEDPESRGLFDDPEILKVSAAKSMAVAKRVASNRVQARRSVRYDFVRGVTRAFRT